MSDYSKLKVVELKAELKKRGLPQTGLKQALVDRLNEADAKQAESAIPQEHAKELVKPDAERRDEGAVVVLEMVTASTIEVAPGDDKAASDTPGTPKAVAQPMFGDAPMAPLADEDAPMSDAPPTANEVPPPLAAPIEPDVAAPQPMSVTEQKVEELEDTRKRKRRSQSPRPSSEEVAQKKAKQEGGSPRVTLHEDVVPHVQPDEVDPTAQATAIVPEESSMLVDQVQVHGDTLVKAAERDEEPVVSNERVESVETPPSPQEVDKPVNHAEGKESVAEKSEYPTLENAIPSPVKPSPSDTRFKNLFNGPAKRDTSPPHQPSYPDDEDRDVTPALHPATSALYIRDFMRPLHPGNLKDHLISLAVAPNLSPKQEIITEFFLDPIRTHCLVGFASIAAASRVRSALHDRVWPDERTRKPLWVDFIPEEKVTEWVGMEQNSTSGRGAPAKRWEVMYENDDKGVEAVFQEVGSASRPLRPDAPTSGTFPPEAGRGVQGAPSGPRNEGHRKPSDTAIPKTNLGFKALDDLFKSTAAKPKLYFLPVAKNVADRRLDRLQALRGGPARIGDEMRRYTFEDGDLFVDKGPEFGAGYRAGYRGRGGGGYSGAYTSRGGGSWREDSWRGRGARP